MVGLKFLFLEVVMLGAGSGCRLLQHKWRPDWAHLASIAISADISVRIILHPKDVKGCRL